MGKPRVGNTVSGERRSLPVADKYNERHTVAEFMGSWRGMRGICPGKLVQEPV